MLFLVLFCFVFNQAWSSRKTGLRFRAFKIYANEGLNNMSGQSLNLRKTIKRICISDGRRSYNQEQNFKMRKRGIEEGLKYFLRKIQNTKLTPEEGENINRTVRMEKHRGNGNNWGFMNEVAFL